MATKFETIGVQFQDEAATPFDAIRSFKYSCRVCCNRGMHIDCDSCAISKHHALVMAAFASVQRPCQKALPGGSV